MSGDKPRDTEIAHAQTLHSGDRLVDTPAVDKAQPDPADIARASTQFVAASSHPAQVRVSEAQLEDDGFESRYETRTLLGRGGMGEVHLCRDRRIGREVALKVIREGYGSRGDMDERFLREARVQGQLEHPAVVPVYDLGRGPDGEPYFTMKRVRGHTLERVLEALRAGDEEARKKFSQRRLLTAITSICLALDFVHGHGVVHRDLKPSNIMLGDFGEVYLLDWGLAKVLGAQESASLPADGSSAGRIESGPTILTAADTLLGTPGYMPREQLVGHLVDVDHRADVYALGAILFELLTLQRLHPGTQLPQVLKSTMDGADARASVRAPEREVPPELEAICVKATATSPAERYGSAREMCEAVERYLDGDRDLQQRREMARRHAEAAEEAAARALAGDGAASEAARRTAMRELGRAFALDPNDARTMKAMVSLLMQPPRELPEEVKGELEQLSRDQVRLGGKTGAIAFASFNMYIPLLLLMGIKSAWTWSTYAIAIVTAAVSFAVWRLPQPRTRHAMLVYVLSLLCMGTLSAMFGPFLVVPASAAVMALIFSTTNDRSLRGVIIVLACLTVLLPLGLEYAHLVPPSMRFTADGILLLPRVVWFPPVATQIFLVVGSLAIIVTAGLALAPFRNELDEAQKRIRLLAWHLRHLVPEEATLTSRAGGMGAS